MARTLRTRPPPISRIDVHLVRALVEDRAARARLARAAGHGRWHELVEVPVLIMHSLPSSPLRDDLAHLADRRVEAVGVAGEQLDAVASAAAFIASASSMVRAIGFSTMTCLPCSAASSVCSACSSSGVAMYTASTFGLAHSASTLGTSRRNRARTVRARRAARARRPRCAVADIQGTAGSGCSPPRAPRCRIATVLDSVTPSP